MFGPRMVKKQPLSLAWPMCLKEVTVSPVAGSLQNSQQDMIPHLPTLKENAFQDVPGCLAMLRGALHSSPQPCLAPHMAFTPSSEAHHRPFWSLSGDKQGPGKMCSEVAVGE